MSQTNNLFIPSDPQTVVQRPLNKGVFYNQALSSIPEGGFSELENFFITQQGLQRRPGWQIALNGSQISLESDTQMLDLLAFWNNAGSVNQGLITSTFLHAVDTFNTTPVYWEYSDGTVSVLGTAVTGASTVWDTSTLILPNDYIVFDPEGENERIRILSIESTTALTLYTAPTNTYSAGTAYKIQRSFSPNSYNNIDSCMAVSSGVNYLVMCDQQRPPYIFDGATLESLNDTLTYYPKCISFWKDRLWMAAIREEGETFAQKIRWSSATDFKSWAESDYMSLPYTMGEIVKMLPLGQSLIIYTTTGTYFGRYTSSPTFPLVVDLMPTGTAGLTSQRGVVNWIGGHFFVGEDDVYFLTEDRNVTPLASATVKKCLENCAYKQYIKIAIDTRNERVIFALPQESKTISILLSFFYKQKAWGVEHKEIEFLSTPQIVTGISWDTLESYIDPATWDEGMAVYTSWDAISGKDSPYSLFYGSNGYLHKLSTDGATDDRETSTDELIPCAFITPEFDFGDVDQEKSFLRFGLKLNTRPLTSVTYTVFCSNDGGNVWENLGQLVIDAEHRESKVDFITTASTIMFKVISNSNVVPYSIVEYSFRVRGRGVEIDVK